MRVSFQPITRIPTGHARARVAARGLAYSLFGQESAFIGTIGKRQKKANECN